MSAPLFNSQAKMDAVTLSNGARVFVIDNALTDPEAMLQFAVANRHAFEHAPFNAYPGIQLRMPDDVSARLDEFFAIHLRAAFQVRRTVHMYSRLAMVTTPPAQLQPRQVICHRDHQHVEAGQAIVASVLYLFRDACLGGTSFYAPAKSEQETALLVHDSSTMSASAFQAKYGIAPGYFHGDARYFTTLGSVPAAWNRMIFYDGAMFHSGDILSPEKLTDDPMTGRLSLNGFFTCSRRAS
jgi:hypothetical protein